MATIDYNVATLDNGYSIEFESDIFVLTAVFTYNLDYEVKIILV